VGAAVAAVRSEDRFVLVALGGEEHLAAAELAVAQLRRYSRRRVTVLTDPRRNRRPLAVAALPVATPVELADAAAAAWLKTSLHRHLDMGHRWCYLDGDVLAVREGVDQVFLYRFGPVTFAPDHCRLPHFSAHAVRCSCRTPERVRQAEELDALLRRIDPRPPELAPARQALLAAIREHERRHEAPPPEVAARRRRVEELLARFAGSPLALLLALAARHQPELGARLLLELWRHRDVSRVVDAAMGDLPSWVRCRTGFTWQAAERRGYDRLGRLLLVDVPFHVARESPFRFDVEREEWLDGEGRLVFYTGCDHLRQAIRRRFGVEVADPDWQHWNGGVFLFDRAAAPFLDTWHEWTMQAFADPEWHDRDQGALVAAAWRHGLQAQGTLPVEHNFLADWNDRQLSCDEARGLSRDGGQTWVDPYLVHVYHHWGDRAWPVWQWIERRSAPRASPAPAAMGTPAP
jgi:hypothetical protein